jgi:hypothetical protein
VSLWSVVRHHFAEVLPLFGGANEVLEDLEAKVSRDREIRFRGAAEALLGAAAISMSSTRRASVWRSRW